MANTRITRGVIKPNENYDTHNIKSTGIITAIGLDISGNASIGGVLTYEDVTSIDSVGIITARAGVVSPNADIDDFVTVGNNIQLGNAGVITATSFSGSGANLTGIDATAIKDTGGNVKIQAQASGAVYTGIHTFNSGAEVGSNIKLGNAGVITATSFVGDGSDLTNLPAGLGTALSATASSPLNKMYYTNQVLGVPSSVTVDVPASASKAYTQYADIKVESSADLIIAEGDDLIPDVLGLADFGTFGGGASAGRIRVNSISNAANDGSPTVQKGLVVTGVCTATSFSGSGANLTSLPAQATIANNADNRLITGGSGVNLNGEASLTFDGTALGITGYTDIRTGSSINTNVTGGSASGTLHKNTNSGEFAVVSGGTGGNNYLSFYTSASASPTEKLRIASNGAFGLNGANYGSSGQVLTSQGSGSPVQWATPTSTSAKASMSTGGGTVSGQRVASDLTYSSGNNNSNVQLGNVTSCNASSVYALELSLTYMHNGSTNHGYLTGYIYQRGKTYGLVGSYVNEQHYDWYYNYTMNRFIIPWDPSGTQALDLYITNAYNTNSNNKFFVDVTNKLENI